MSLAKKLKPQGVRVGGINCRSKKTKGICQGRGISQYPAFYVVIDGEGHEYESQPNTNYLTEKKVVSFIHEKLSQSKDVFNLRLVPQVEKFIQETLMTKKKSV